LCAHPACNQQLDFEIRIILRAEGRIFAFLCLIESLSRALGEEHRRSEPLRPVRLLSLASDGRSGVWVVRSGHGLGTANRWVFGRPRRFHCPHPAWRGSVKTPGRAGVASRRAYPARAAARPQPMARMLIATASWRAERRSIPHELGIGGRRAELSSRASLGFHADPAGWSRPVRRVRSCIESGERFGGPGCCDSGQPSAAPKAVAESRSADPCANGAVCRSRNFRGESVPNSSAATRSASQGLPAAWRKEAMRTTCQAYHRSFPCQRRLKFPHIAGRIFPSPGQVVVDNFGRRLQSRFRPVKRRQALLESNLPRNIRPETHRGRWEGRGVEVAPFIVAWG
jgi:hypothetical protein